MNYELKDKNRIDELKNYGFKRHPYPNLTIPYGLTIKKGNGVLNFYVYKSGEFNLEITKYDEDYIHDIIDEFEEVRGNLIVAGLIREVYDEEE
jgi:hypothetical protein